MVRFVILSTLILGCASGGQPSPGVAAEVDSAVPGCGFDLSRAGFVGELLEARGTARTPHFDDYTAGSYHVAKADLLAAIERVAVGREDVLGALLVGPFGPLWAYEVYLFRDVQEGVRVNRVLMPHARITLKGTTLLAREEFEEVVHELSGLLRFGDTYPPNDSEYGLAAVFLEPTVRRAHLTFSWYDAELPQEEVQPLADALRRLLTDEVVTYSTELPEEFGTIDSCDDR